MQILYFFADVKELTQACNTILNVLTKQSPLHNESAIVSRFIYKFDKKFRNDLGYRNLKKVNTALKKYLLLNLMKDVENFISALPSEDDQYLPTRQMLEYLLVRIITFSKLMFRICVCSKQAAIFYLDRVKRGESHWMSLMPYALLSRVWSVTKVLLQHSCSWYSRLQPFLFELKLKGLDFLPKDYNLPLDLEEWLDMKNLDVVGRFEWSQKKQIQIDAGLIEDNEGEVLDNILKFANQINTENTEEDTEIDSDMKKIEKSDEIQFTSIKNVDLGEAISRDMLKNLSNAVPGLPQKKINHSADRVTNKESLKQFIVTEEELRNESNSKSLTQHLSFMQWQALKNSLNQLYDSLANNRKIERKFQKLWKEKCLDYS